MKVAGLKRRRLFVGRQERSKLRRLWDVSEAGGREERRRKGRRKEMI